MSSFTQNTRFQSVFLLTCFLSGCIVEEPSTESTTTTEATTVIQTTEAIAANTENTTQYPAVTEAILPTNKPPIANNDIVPAIEDTNLLLTRLLANDTDEEKDTLTIASFEQASHGTISKTADGNLEYIPEPNFHGIDSFVYQITDNAGNFANATVTIDVSATNDVPLAINDVVTGKQNTQININALNNDSGLGDTPFGVQVAGAANHGTLNINHAGDFQYTPALNFFGNDSFTYKITDTDGDTTLASVNITVTCDAVCNKTLKLSWNASTSSNVVGYKIHVGNASGSYTKFFNVGNVTSYDYVATQIGTYYFVVTAIDSNKLESDYSNEANGAF